MEATAERSSFSFSFSPNHQNGLVLLSFLFLLLSPEISVNVSGQPEFPSDNNHPHHFNRGYTRFGPYMAIFTVILIAGVLFLGFFYMRRRSSSFGSSSVRRTLPMLYNRTPAARGLDASFIHTFPTFTYSEVKNHKIGKEELECAVCLNEFGDDETLRLIPKCDHVFHPECIDVWLESHVTCPVCRANLIPLPSDKPVHLSWSRNNEVASENYNVERTGSRNQEFVIQVQDLTQETRSFKYPKSWSVRKPKMFEALAKFRSHSTGHESLVQPGKDLERFTLRLPAELRKEIMDRAFSNRTSSCATTLPREGSSRRGYRDDSSQSGRSWLSIELDRQEKSDRWVVFTRVLSTRSGVVPNTGEASTRSKTPMKMPSLRCLEPKAADEAGLVEEDAARNPV